MVRQLVDKAVRCAEAEGLRTVAIAGGVAANSGLRAAMAQEGERRGRMLVGVMGPIGRSEALEEASEDRRAAAFIGAAK